MPHPSQTSFDILKILNVFVIVISLLVCLVLMLLPIPGVELLATSPNWLLIWLIAWSLKKSVWQSAIAGLCIGWTYDAITNDNPSYAVAFIIVGVCTSRLQKQKYIGEDFISVAFIVFFMTIISETIFALQYWSIHSLSLTEIFPKYQQITIISAIITSLWSPVFYYPYNYWEQKMKQLERKAIK